jgi:hypothetical protein
MPEANTFRSNRCERLRSHTCNLQNYDVWRDHFTNIFVALLVTRIGTWIVICDFYSFIACRAIYYTDCVAQVMCGLIEKCVSYVILTWCDKNWWREKIIHTMQTRMKC